MNIFNKLLKGFALLKRRPKSGTGCRDFFTRIKLIHLLYIFMCGVPISASNYSLGLPDSLYLNQNVKVTFKAKTFDINSPKKSLYGTVSAISNDTVSIHLDSTGAYVDYLSNENLIHNTGGLDYFLLKKDVLLMIKNKDL